MRRRGARRRAHARRRSPRRRCASPRRRRAAPRSAPGRTAGGHRRCGAARGSRSAAPRLRSVFGLTPSIAAAAFVRMTPMCRVVDVCAGFLKGRKPICTMGAILRVKESCRAPPTRKERGRPSVRSTGPVTPVAKDVGPGQPSGASTMSAALAPHGPTAREPADAPFTHGRSDEVVDVAVATRGVDDGRRKAFDPGRLGVGRDEEVGDRAVDGLGLRVRRAASRRGARRRRSACGRRRAGRAPCVVGARLAGALTIRPRWQLEQTRFCVSGSRAAARSGRRRRRSGSLVCEAGKNLKRSGGRSCRGGAA